MKAQLSRERLEAIASLPLKTTSWGLEHAPGAYSTVRSHEIVEMARMLLGGMDNGYDITSSQLREAVHYNPETGKFMRRSNGHPMEHVDGSGYYCFNLFKKSRLAHRMAFYYMTGRLPERVDHIDGNRLNNEWKNLREATHAENMWNTGMISTNASGVKGVYWNKKLKRWVAEIRTNGKKHYVGSFVDLEEARDAIEDRRKELHGEFFNPCSKAETAAPPAPVAVPDVGREQFEAWVKFHLDDEHSIVTLHRANGGLNYRDPHVDLAWIAWKESRAAMLQGAENAESRCTIHTAPALDSSPKNAKSRSGNSTVVPDCSCRTCHPVTFTDSRFVVCPECGNKRCPRANDHRNACTGSNEPGQVGSAYPAAPEQEE